MCPSVSRVLFIKLPLLQSAAHEYLYVQTSNIYGTYTHCDKYWQVASQYLLKAVLVASLNIVSLAIVHFFFNTIRNLENHFTLDFTCGRVVAVNMESTRNKLALLGSLSARE